MAYTCKLVVMSGYFEIVETNPNDSVGGGGCLRSESKHTDCRGPYVLFPYVEMENNLSPHAVICSAHLEEVHEALSDKGARLAGGEKDPDVIEGTATELEPELIPKV